MSVTLETTGHIEAMSLWAGESVGGVKRIQPAADIVMELVEDAEKLLQRWA
jgi:NAD(P)H-dependent flavin oxidoreductase YrpB (nitropropane dioxygenase family)